MKTPILGSTYVARSVNAADARMVNMFPEMVPEAGKEPAFLMRAPGLNLLATVGSGPIRGLWQLNGYMYVVSGNTLYKVNSSYSATAVGTVANNGPVSISDNGTQIFIAANPQGYIYNTSTGVFQQIGGDFPGAVTVGYLDGYFVFNEPNSQKFWVTALLDGTSVNALDFASAEGSPDGLVGLIVDHREVWLFGTNSVEVWYDAGLLDFPLQRIQGAFNEIGCAAAYSIAKMDNCVFWLGQDARGNGIVYRGQGYTGQRISTHAVEWQIQQYGDVSDAIGYTYQQDGHSFYVLIFPTANTTWVFDVATGAWHERAGWVNGEWTRHRSNCQVFFNSQTIVGDYEDGRIYAFDLDYYKDDNLPQRWYRSWRALPTGQNDLKRSAQHSLQLDCETGIGINGYSSIELISTGSYTINPFGTGASNTVKYNGVGQPNVNVGNSVSGDFIPDDTTVLSVYYNDPFWYVQLSNTVTTEDTVVKTLSFYSVPVVGADPQVMMRWSDDGGHTWSYEHWNKMGKIGQYGYRTIWRRLGMTTKIRDRVYEVSGTDPIKLAIMGAELFVTPTNA